MGGKDLNGVLVIDKPAGISSAKVVAAVKKLLKVRKAGHAGTLDPIATGVLVCCINDATRLARFFLHDRKKYQAVLELGKDTDTQDSTGKIITTCDTVSVPVTEIRNAFDRFQGEFDQIPPSYSALKHKGIPLYKYARKGDPVKKPARRVQIFDLNICKINLPLVHFEVTCSGGTYIRTLCSDIGKKIGCGGCLKELRRVDSSGFSIEDAYTLSELEERVISGKHLSRMVGMAESLHHMPVIGVDERLEEKIRHGAMITGEDLPGEASLPHEGFLKVLNGKQELIAVISHDRNTDKLKYCCVFN